MIDRYTDNDFRRIWSDEYRFRKYLKVEIAHVKVLMEHGIVPKEDYELIEKNADFSLESLYKIEEETKHDVIAFTRAVSESLGEERKWLHYGLTSSDVIDTAYALLYKEANELIEKDLEEIHEVLKDLAIRYKDVASIGRTHGIHAEVTSFGLKWALYYDEISRDIKRFRNARCNIEVGKLSGAIGTFANFDPSFQDEVCNDLALASTSIATQVIQRDRHMEYFATLAIIASTVEKIALEIRHLQRTEVSEVNEPFSKGQKGSSAMPHKKNPIGSENICGLVRVIKAYTNAINDDNALWHERDISHSSVERIIAPDATTLVHYILKRMTRILKGLEVHEDNIRRNLYMTNGVIFSERFLSTLVSKGLSREAAYDLIQPLALKSYNENIAFKDLILNSDVMKYLNNTEVEACFDEGYYLKRVDDIYRRVGISQ